MKNKELEEYLKNLNCRGCYCKCPLNSPNCARSNVFIKEATEKWQSNKKEN